MSTALWMGQKHICQYGDSTGRADAVIAESVDVGWRSFATQ